MLNGTSMKIDRQTLIDKLRVATTSMTHEMIATRVTLDPESGCNPRREHVTHALSGRSGKYDYVLVGMANVFLKGDWSKAYFFTNENHKPHEKEEVEA